MISRRLPALLFGIVALAAHADSITILVDASYSMSLGVTEGEPGTTRLAAVADELDRFLENQPADTRYALLVAEHAATVSLRLPYPARAQQVREEVDAIVPWGSIDLIRAIARAAETAASIARSREDAGATLVVLTDAEDLSLLTGPRMPILPDGIILQVIEPPLDTPARLSAHLAAVEARDPGALERLLPVTPERESGETDAMSQPQDERRATEARQVPVAGASPHRERTGGAASGGRSRRLLLRWVRLSRWGFLAAVAIGLAGVARAYAYHARRLARVAEHNARPPVVTLEARATGTRGESEIASYPVTVNAAFLRSFDPALENAEGGFALEERDGTIVLVARDGVRVNGMMRSEREIRGGEQIRLGSVRIIVRTVEPVKPARPPRPRHHTYWLAPASAAAAAIVAFFIAAIAGQGEAAPSQETLLAAANHGASSAAPALERTVHERLIPGRAAASVAVPQAHALTAASMPPLRLPVELAPGETLPNDDLDYLAIHAHPDDEALDFGALLVRMNAAGLRGAVLLLTDGNAGLDQYPWRATGSGYPAYDLAGAELASVRTAEAAEAIGWLGTHYYLRMGLANHPHGSPTEVLSTDELIARWGGHEELVERIASTIRALNPEVVLSPDLPSAAREHFEHEATGILVHDALARLEADQVSPVRLHVIAVDALQAHLCTAADRPLFRLSPWLPDAQGQVPRLRQALALRAHRTQRDATVIGVETRLSLRWDHFILHSHGDHPALGLDWQAVDP
ncbi:MAG: PIG-L family deacetylase [Spirochaetota bacterium]